VTIRINFDQNRLNNIMASDPTPSAPEARSDIASPRTSDKTLQVDSAPQQRMSRTSTTSSLGSSSSSPPATQEHFPSFPFHMPHTHLKSSKTVPTTSSQSTSQQISKSSEPSSNSRSKSAGDLPPPPTRIPSGSTPPMSHGWIQKKPHPSGTMGAYGRHGDDWLFGDISITRTALGIVSKAKGRKEEKR
jgi:hypothetical protein